MARIYDNIEIKFEQGLNDIIINTGVKRVDFYNRQNEMRAV